MPKRRLTGREILELRTVIVAAITSTEELEELVLLALNERLDNIVAPGALNTRVLIEFTEACERTPIPSRGS